MSDWAGFDGAETADRYRRMARTELAGVSPSYAMLCEGVAADADLLGLLAGVPRAKRQPNLLLAAVRYLGGPVDSWPAFRAFVVREWEPVRALLLTRRTQTNEAGRCAVLLPVLAQLPGPLALLEVGAAAGLCLHPGRYAYRYDTDAGPPVRLGTGPVQLTCRVTGPAPLPRSLPDVVWRAGLDLHPLDVTRDDDVRWLESLIWPEQHERFAILRAAVEIARRQPASIMTGDLTRDLGRLAAQAPAEATLVIFHTAVLAYVDEAGRAAFRAAVAAVTAARQARGAATRPTHWVANEAPHVLGSALRPRADTGAAQFVLALDGRPVALAGPHGATLDWAAKSGAAE